jgi:hypothetical protein
MKHAGPSALDRIEPLLVEMRAMALLKERSRGTLYRGSRAFLHFHEHGDDLFADIRYSDEWERIQVTTAAQRQLLKCEVAKAFTKAKLPPP